MESISFPTHITKNREKKNHKTTQAPLKYPTTTRFYHHGLRMAILPRPAKVVGWKWGEILAPHHRARQRWVQTFQTKPTPPYIDKHQIVNFSYPKTLLFKQTCHQLIVLYTTRLSASFLFFSSLFFFFFFPSSKFGNKVPILTFSFVFIIDKFIYY